MKTIRFGHYHTDYSFCVPVDKILYVSKSEDGEITFVHLITGEILESESSMNTIEARMENPD